VNVPAKIVRVRVLVTITTPVGATGSGVVSTRVRDPEVKIEGGKTILGLLRQIYTISIAVEEVIIVDV
jgi:hypothetical protein